jgi:Mlc titration factor MtfA (ptsG expression regulator)
VARWRRRRGRPLPETADELFGRHLAEWAYLDGDERSTLREITEELLATTRWEAAQGFVLTDEMCTVIAAQGALMALGLGVEVFHEVGTIVVHPTTMTSVGSRAGPVDGLLTDEPVYLHGEAHHFGPVLLAWDAVRRDTRRFGHGDNVVVHELTHKLDMLDGLIDGTPPLPAEQRDRWVEVCSREYRALQAGADDPVLRDYAATDTGEFFAVAAEVFFDRPVALAIAKPQLYEVLRDYFGCDPAARRARVVWEDRPRAHPST